MANFNKVTLIGRLVDNAKVYDFSNGGRVANFTIAVNHRKFNSEKNTWEDEASFFDAKLFSRGDNDRGGRTQTDRVGVFTKYIHKGNQVFIEGQLRQEKWTTEEGQNRSKIVIFVDNFQILESPRGESSGGSDYEMQDDFGAEDIPAPRRGGNASMPREETSSYSGGGGGDDDIPF